LHKSNNLGVSPLTAKRRAFTLRSNALIFRS
jgi:hypothetical protein